MWGGGHEVIKPDINETQSTTNRCATSELFPMPTKIGCRIKLLFQDFIPQKLLLFLSVAGIFHRS
jgi:hypothetical protein